MMKRLLSWAWVITLLVSIACSPKISAVSSMANDTLKIMSYNIHHCNPPSDAGLIDVNAIAAVIRKEAPDVVALQEVDVNTGRSGPFNQAKEIASKAGYDYFFFAKAIDFDGGQYGVAILSKYLLLDTAVHRLPTDASTRGEPRILATATVTLPNGKKIRIGCTHLDAQKNDGNRLLQITKLDSIARAIKEPFVLAGDFNAREGSAVINILDKNFIRTCQQCKATLPGGREGAIDFVAFKPKSVFTVLSHQVIEERHASDHFPIVSTLQLQF